MKTILLEAIPADEVRPRSIICIYEKKIATVYADSSTEFEQNILYYDWQINQIKLVNDNFFFFFNNLIHLQKHTNGSNL